MEPRAIPFLAQCTTLVMFHLSLNSSTLNNFQTCLNNILGVPGSFSKVVMLWGICLALCLRLTQCVDRGAGVSLYAKSIVCLAVFGGLEPIPLSKGKKFLI